MKKARFKKGISSLLAATMVATMVAPALPVYAATASIYFNYSALNGSVGTSFDNMSTKTGTLGDSIGSRDLPYWNATGTGSFNPTGWSPDLVGYRIAGWYRTIEDKANGVKKNQLDTGNYPYSDKTYYAQLEADPAHLNDWGVTVTHQNTSTIPEVPAAISGSGADATSNYHKAVLQGVSETAKNVPGFKVATTNPGVVTMDSTTLPTTNVAHPTAAVSPLFAGSTPGNLMYNEDTKTVSGTMINKNLDIKFNYEVDPSQKFPVKVVHQVVEGGTVVSTKVDTTQREYSVGTDLSTAGIAPDSQMITVRPGDPASQYVLDDVTVGLTNTAATATTSPYLLSDVSNLSTATTGVHPDSNNNIVGHMLNQGVTVTYTYHKNPNYYMTLKVNYVDSMGTDITDRVVAKTIQDGAAAYATSVGSATATNPAYITTGTGGDLQYRVNAASGQTFTIPTPILSGYNANPSLSANGNEWSNANFDQLPTSGYTISTGPAPNGSATVTVTYEVDTANVAIVNADSDGRGELWVNNTHEYDPGQNATDQINVIKSHRVVSGTTATYDLTINPSDLPTPRPADGYRFKEWQFKDPVTGTYSPITLPFTKTGLPENVGTQSVVNLLAVFEKEPSMWTTYNFVAGNSDVDISRVTTPTEMLSKRWDYSNPAAPVTVDINRTWDDADVQTNMANVASATVTASAPAGSAVRWLDSNGTVMGTGVPMALGGTFTAYAANNTSGGVYTPLIIDPATNTAGNVGGVDSHGTPYIAIDRMSPQGIDSTLNYVLTDDAGNVVAIVPGNSVMANNGHIIDPAIVPGYNYNVATADPTAAVTVGSPLPSGVANVSSPAGPVRIPATAYADDDDNNIGRKQIVVKPTSPNTEYALYDDNGNLVSPFTSDPSQVTFDNLPDGRNFVVVPRRVGDTNVPNPATFGTPVNTGNVITRTVPHSVSILLPSGLPADSVKINGVAQTVSDRITNINANDTVEIKVPLSDANYNLFNGNFIVTGNPSNLSTTSDTVTFKMPDNDVTVQAAYYAPGVNWNNNNVPTPGTSTDPIVYTGSADPSNTAVTVPQITAPGTYRVVVDRQPQSSAFKSTIQSDFTDTYNDEWMTNVRVEVWDATTSTWLPYSGAVSPMRTVFTTGLLRRGTREYSLYSSQTATPSSATREHGSYESEWASPNYSGSFETNVDNNAWYAFGYTANPGITVVVKSNRNASYVSTISSIYGSHSLSEYASMYQNEITAERATTVDVNGVTWTYRGLSTSPTSYVPFNENSILTDDMTVYIYFDNDADQRANTAGALNNAITRAQGMVNARNLTIADEARLQDAINRANAILSQTSPRKASTPELQAILDEINRYLGVRPIISGGGGGSRGSSGGSGGGSGSSSGVINTQANVQAAGAYRVGVDGDWELVDAANHKWVFNLKNGTRVTGWQKLAYTYGNTTRTEWYHFAGDNIMDHGWFLDQNTNRWYYLSDVHDGFFGHMVEGWHQDDQDGRWYYQNLNSGEMLLNWQHIGDAWYYLNPYNNGPTWFYNNATQTWDYSNNSDRPYGSLYVNETTKDGYKVDENGRWVK